jgi:hypothetical protein
MRSYECALKENTVKGFLLRPTFATHCVFRVASYQLTLFHVHCYYVLTEEAHIEVQDCLIN